MDAPPLKTWRVLTNLFEDANPEKLQEYDVTAHLVFDNTSRGEGLCFRRYHENQPTTYVVALFAPGTWQNFREIPNG